MLETEKKIILPPDQMEAVFDVFSPEDYASKHFPRAYYDTLDLRLNSRRVAVRLQNAGDGKSKQTIKAARDNIGDTLVRAEWDFIIEGSTPDFTMIKDVEILNALHGVAANELVHLFTSDVKRRYFDLARDGGIVEVAFDLGRIYLPDNTAEIPMCEIEVELKSGPPHLVDRVAEEILAQSKDAKISQVSKAERGIELYRAAESAGR